MIKKGGMRDEFLMLHVPQIAMRIVPQARAHDGTGRMMNGYPIFE